MNDNSLMLAYVLKDRSKTDFCRMHKISIHRLAAMERGDADIKGSLLVIINKLFGIKVKSEKLAVLRQEYRKAYEITLPKEAKFEPVYDAGESPIIPSRKGGAGGGSNNSGPINVTDIYC
jgi:hypothetical protein